MTGPRYLSLFSGVGGLEHPDVAPVLACELDASCRTVLGRHYPHIDLWADVQTLQPPAVEMVVGGWPCQDLSSAGKLGGLAGRRSGLFFEMLRVASESNAETVVGENVPNLLTLNRGQEFDAVLRALTDAGFPYVSWRILNARSFGLPQERRRLFIVASKRLATAEALHAALPEFHGSPKDSRFAAGFYWTGGKRSICFSPGYVPALKIGATDEKGRSPVAVFVDGRVRKLNVCENLRLQGLAHIDVSGMPRSAVLRMAGNAVAPPVGQFVIRSVAETAPPSGVKTGFGAIGAAGILEDGLPWIVEHEPEALADNLTDLLDHDDDTSLTAQAAAGLVVRSVRSGLPLPLEMFDALIELTRDRSQRVHPSRGNSFEALDAMELELARYATKLPPTESYGGPKEARATQVKQLRGVG